MYLAQETTNRFCLPNIGSGRAICRTMVAMLCAVFAAQMQAQPVSDAPSTAEVYFIQPLDGAHIIGDVHVVMGLRGMGVAPAGTATPNTGHHHLIINAPTPAAGSAIPSDDRHRHFGGGQTETFLRLAPGEYRLQLVLGDLAHRLHTPSVVSRTIAITVLDPDKPSNGK